MSGSPTQRGFPPRAEILAEMLRTRAGDRRPPGELKPVKHSRTWIGRGRDTSYPVPPAQIPASGTTAPYVLEHIRCVKHARWDLCGGVLSNEHSYRDRQPLG
jgi:hypothetical protein